MICSPFLVNPKTVSLKKKKKKKIWFYEQLNYPQTTYCFIIVTLFPHAFLFFFYFVVSQIFLLYHIFNFDNDSTAQLWFCQCEVNWVIAADILNDFMNTWTPLTLYYLTVETSWRRGFCSNCSCCCRCSWHINSTSSVQSSCRRWKRNLFKLVDNLHCWTY